MKISVQTKPGAKKSEVIEVSQGVFKVKVNAKAIDGAANIRLIEILAEHFQVPFGAIRILSGATSREKIIEIIGK
jgi:uncharacterized protein (TIGR00251 family)